MSDQKLVVDSGSSSADTSAGKLLSEHERDNNSFDKEKLSTSNLSEDSDMKDNQINQDTVETDKEQTIEPVYKVDNAEQSNSRELKLLLALSRESNLDTNISRKIKRKTSEHSKKDKDFHYPHGKSKHKHMHSSGKSPKKTLDVKLVRYPVTAESELESELITENEKTDSSGESSTKRKREGLTEDSSVGGASDEVIKKRKSLSNEVVMFKPSKDMFCWRCHRDGVNIACETCVRAYHQKCLKQTIVDPEHWPCPECVSILKAESTQSRSEAMKGMTLEHLCGLLKFAVNRMIQCQGSEPFIHPVSDKEFPEYKKYIIQPMNLTLLEKNIKDNFYGSPQAFEADAKWILHNSIIFNSFQSKLTYVAKNIIRICKQEMAEIENCPSCYLNANTKKKTWFTEICPKPHLIAWAKLKGFPYWPAKIMCFKDDLADVRFFGAHDRAWVPHRDCYLFSVEDPNSFKQKRQDIEQCINELKVYVGNLKKIYGKFKYAPFKTMLDPYNEMKQLHIFLPNFGKTEIESKDSQETDCVINNVDDKHENKKKVQRDDFDEKETKESDKVSNDNESMEGYGTDDESMVNIDTEKRKRLLGCVEKDLEEEIEGEDEDDTQVLSVTASLLKKRAKISGNFHNIGVKGKGKVANRKSTDSDSKQFSAEKPHCLEIGARRNSETSIKSDSSRVSNHSDKINKVDISENMEISLRNDYTGCSVSENISSNNSESSRSDSDISVELKRKPVQIDIENTEYTISPSNKLKIADKLMKRLSDEGENSNSEPTAEGKIPIEDSRPETSTDQTNKSQTDLLIEKFKEVVQHKVVDFSIPMVGTKNGDSNNSSEEPEQGLSISSNKKPIKDNTFNEVKSPRGKPSSTGSEITESSNSSMKKDCESVEKEKRFVLSALKNESGKNKSDQFIAKERRLIIPALNMPSDSIDPETISINGSERNESKRKIDEVECDNNEICNIETSTKDKSKKVDMDNSHTDTEKASNAMDSTENYVNPTKHYLDTLSELDSTIVEKPKDENENNKKGEPPASLNIIEEVLPDEDDHEQVLDETQIDQASIMSIIHSSLDVSNKNSNVKHTDVAKTQMKERNKENSTETKRPKETTFSSAKVIQNKDTPIVGELLKRKASDEMDSSPSKVFKLVPMRNISNGNEEKSKSKPDENESGSVERTNNNPVENPILLKSISESKSITNETPSSSSHSIEEISPVEVKSEPDSEIEPENLEAKKKYLSALQIAEKKDIPDHAKSKNHIRTRARAEEKRERFKSNVDNLAKIIDNVALNYSIAKDGKELSLKKSEKLKSYSNLNRKEGEIFVKSFAKMVPKQRARKSFPMPNYAKPKTMLHHKEGVKTVTKVTSVSKPQISTGINNTNTQSPVVSTTNKSTTGVKPVAPNTVIAQPLEAVKTSNGYLVLQTPQTNEYVLLPNQSLSFPAQTASQVPSVSKVISSPGSSTSLPIKPAQTKRSVEVNCSQNYIPQNEENTESETLSPHRSILIKNQIDQSLPIAKLTTSTQQLATIPQAPPIVEVPQPPQQLAQQSQGSEQETSETQTEDEFSVLNSMMPENVSKTISSLLRRPPPKLKPRPPGMLSTNFADGNPSSAGDVSSRINSVAHRLGDYFRGMLIETLDDLGKSNNSEATIIQLKLEIESLKHKHSVELAEIEKNMCTVLKDIQRSIIEDRDKIVDETRAQCELEAIKRIEEAKSKQWCANCSKEAQFYCCWNTSYCDYPCQQKHWPQHMSKCTQNLNHTPVTTSVHCPSGQPIILRPAHPPSKPGVGRFVTKPVHKVYMNRNIGNILPKSVKMQSPSHMAVVETSPGNFQVVSAPVTFRSSNLSTVKSTTATQQFTSDKPSPPKQKVIAPMMPVATILDDSD